MNFQTPLRYIFTTNRSLKIQIPIVGGMRKNLYCAAPILLFFKFFFKVFFLFFTVNKLTLTNTLSPSPPILKTFLFGRTIEKKDERTMVSSFYIFFCFLFLIGNLFPFLSFFRNLAEWTKPNDRDPERT